MKTNPEQPKKLIPIARETAVWLAAAAAVATVGADIEEKITGREPTGMPRLAKTLGMVGLMRAGHAATEYMHPDPEGVPSPHLGQMMVAEPIVDRLHAIGDRLHDYVTA